MPRDVERGLDLVESAAGDAYARAYAFLGAIYEGGYGIERDEVLARNHYISGAEFGDPRAQYRLALGHYRGELVLAKDIRSAAHWFTAAAEQGDGDAQAFLAGMIERGEHTDRDPVEALKWALLACQAEGAPGAEVRARLLGDLSAEQVAEAKRREATWLDIKAASRGTYDLRELLEVFDSAQ